MKNYYTKRIGTVVGHNISNSTYFDKFKCGSLLIHRILMNETSRLTSNSHNWQMTHITVEKQVRVRSPGLGGPS